MHEALTMAKDALHGVAWHPIETAPKDWTHILLYDGSSVVEGYWDLISHEWLYANMTIHDECCIIDNPTRWTPLPDVPR